MHVQHTISLHNILVTADMYWNVPPFVWCFEDRISHLGPGASQFKTAVWTWPSLKNCLWANFRMTVRDFACDPYTVDISRWISVLVKHFALQKTYCPEYFNVGVSFQLTRYFFLKLRNNGCHYPNENGSTVGSRSTELLSAQVLILFRNVDIHVGTSITYFLNAHWIKIKFIERGTLMHSLNKMLKVALKLFRFSKKMCLLRNRMVCSIFHKKYKKLNYYSTTFLLTFS